ncbi:MAG TPA: RNA polymerase sigma factor [Candidatus Kapabacteria bacterium]|nr:RNA polymerase sigma factor [Candidatus Kapabacteria bacterium]
MHEERLERFEDFRDANDRSSAGNDASSSGNDASSSGSDASSTENDSSSTPKDASSVPDGASLGGGTEWIAEAREEASRRKSDHPRRKNVESQAFLDQRRGQESLAVSGPIAKDGSDEALFLRYQQGDDRAFFTIYERYKSSIYAYCAQVLFSAGLSRESVEDTFQDVFLRLVQYRDTFTGGDFKPWIFTVTRHSCLSMKKRSFRQRATIDNIGDGVNFEEGIAMEVRQAFSMSDDPLERMSAEEQTGLLLAAIARLPEEFREALLLSEYEGMTYDEIGHVLGASLSTIRIRIFRAKARLRKMLLPVIGDANGEIPATDDSKKKKV